LLPVFLVRSRLLRALLVLVVVALAASSARADRADQHYKRAVKAYENKEFSVAIREFQAAYRARQLPKILLNIGQVYRKLGMASTALKFYEHYLRVEPNPKEEIKNEVLGYIAQTRAMLDPPEFVAPGAMSAAEAAAAAVASAPSNLQQQSPVPELYSDDDLKSLPQGQTRTQPTGARSPQAALTQPVVAQPLPGTPPPSTAPALPLVPTPETTVTPPQKKPPFYKEAWFWGIVGGAAGAILITGVAVGAQRNGSLPTEILHPTK
jgi:hypothetical protein